MSWEMIAIGAGALGEAFGTYAEGQAQRMFAEHNALMSEFDAEFVEIQATLNERLIRVEEDLALDSILAEEKKAIGAARAFAGSSGFATDAGSNLDQTTEIDRSVAMDAALIRVGADVNVALARMAASLQSGQLRSRADVLRAEGAFAEETAEVGAVTTLLSRGSQVSPLLKRKSKSESANQEIQ